MQPIQKQCLPALQKIYTEIKKDKKTLAANLFDDELDKRADALLAYSLAKEQGFVCCYCSNRIEERKKPDGTIIRGNKTEKGADIDSTDADALPLYHCKVEHFKPRTVYDGKVKSPDLRIDYSNLLCACLGHTGDIQHCDTLKGDKEFKELPNPAEIKAKDFQRLYQLEYTMLGVIRSANAVINAEIGGEEDKAKTTSDKVVYKEGVLNLNAEDLIEEREKAWKAVFNPIIKQLGAAKDWEAKPKQVKAVVEDYCTIYKQKHQDKYKPFYSCVLYLLKKKFRRFL